MLDDHSRLISQHSVLHSPNTQPGKVACRVRYLDTSKESAVSTPSPYVVASFIDFSVKRQRPFHAQPSASRKYYAKSLSKHLEESHTALPSKPSPEAKRILTNPKSKH